MKVKPHQLQTRVIIKSKCDYHHDKIVKPAQLVQRI